MRVTAADHMAILCRCIHIDSEDVSVLGAIPGSILAQDPVQTLSCIVILEFIVRSKTVIFDSFALFTVVLGTELELCDCTDCLVVAMVD